MAWPLVLMLYIGAMTAPWRGSEGGLLSGIAWVGVLFLVVGIIWGIRKREPRLLWFLVPVGLSELSVAVPLLLRLPIAAPSLLWWTALVYFSVQTLILIRIIHMLHWQGNGAHLPGLLVGSFVAVYALIPFVILLLGSAGL